MKRIVGVLVLLLFVQIGVSQDYMDEIAKVSCDCVSELSDTLNKDEYTMSFGLCIIEAAQPYSKKLKKDHKLDFDQMDGPMGEKLGKLVAMKMGAQCPAILIELTKKISEAGEEGVLVTDDKVIGTTQKIVQGEVTKVEDDFFVVFHVKDEQGKVMKYYWFDYLDNEHDLINTYKTVVGKNITLTFVINEFFDPKIGEYRQFYSIKQLSIVK